MKTEDRRTFLKAGAGIAALGILRPERILGANDRARIGICGLRGRGFDHVKRFSKVPGVEIAAVCDIDMRAMRGAVKLAARAEGVATRAGGDGGLKARRGCGFTTRAGAEVGSAR